MNRPLTLAEAIEHRRSYYRLAPESPVADTEIERLLRHAVLHVPSGFNSQSSRLVLLLGDEHRRLWEIVKRTLQAMVPESAFGRTRDKIDGSFASGYGTVLFFEEQTVVEKLQADFPLYAAQMPTFSQHTSAMHQFAVWTLLEEAGFGASLQHYNPLIDDEVRRTWRLPDSWRLVAQMPFGTPAAEPGPKEFEPVDERLRIFR